MALRILIKIVIAVILRTELFVFLLFDYVLLDVVNVKLNECLFELLMRVLCFQECDTIEVKYKDVERRSREHVQPVVLDLDINDLMAPHALTVPRQVYRPNAAL